MSSLDQAFIKAYKRSPAAAQTTPSYESPQPSMDPPTKPYAEPASAPQRSVQDVWHGAGVRYRVDGPHLTADSATRVPHMHVSPQAYADLGHNSPYCATPPHPPAAASRPHFAVAPPVFAGAPTGKLPDPELPSIFRETDSSNPTAAEEEAVKAFSPDWEVDHFVWPAICTRLLESEATYFRHVGQRLLEATAEYPHVLMIAGCQRGEGRTTLALCLARCAARAGVKVALLDADFENPQLGTRLGMEIPCGWSEVLHGKAPLNEAAVASVADQLTLFPLTDAKSVDVEPGEAGLISLLQEISSQYPLVVVDVGPLGAEDRHPFASDEVCPVNAAIVVRDLRYTSEKKANTTAQHLERSGIPAVGIAENFAETID